MINSYKQMMLMAALSQLESEMYKDLKKQPSIVLTVPADLGMPVHPYSHKKSKGDKKRSRAERRRRGK